MARRRIAAVLLAAAVVGGAGGYGVGELTMPDPTDASGPQPVAEVTTEPVKTPLPDGTRALRADDLDYRTEKFDAEEEVRSRVTLRVPKGWAFTKPEQSQGRYTDPTRKRWIRVEAGFKPTLSPAAAMQRKIEELSRIDPTVGLRILERQSGSSRHVDGTLMTHSTLTYTYIPERVLRLVTMRWISFGEDDRASVEVSVLGLPKDREALLDIMQQATRTIERSDSH